jgi:hypothetical protein
MAHGEQIHNRGSGIRKIEELAMSIIIGGINLAESIINFEYELNRTQQILDWVIQHNQIKPPSAADMARIEGEAFSYLTKKYPHAGISAKAKG